MSNNLLIQLKEQMVRTKKLLEKYQAAGEEDNESFVYLTNCRQMAKFAMRELAYTDIKLALEALRSFVD